MKKTLYYAVAGSLMFSACNSDQKETKESLLSQEVMQAEIPKEEKVKEEAKEGVILWPTLSVRASGEDKGKYLTAVYQGEMVTLLGETVTDENSSKKNVYAKVELSDGKVGWVQQTFLAEGAKPAAMVVDADVYRRPDLLSKGDKTFKRMDFVAIQEENDKWIRIIGIPQGATWFTEGWVQKKKVGTDPVDVSFAVLVNRAMQEKKEEDKNEALRQLLENPDLQDSQFHADFQEDEAVEEDLIEREETSQDAMPQEEVADDSDEIL